MMTNPAVDRHLVELVESMTSWALAEANLAHDLGRPDVYLGGDGLRPYVTWSDDGVVRVAGRQPPHLPAPKLVDELIAGSHGLASVTRDPDRPESYALTLPRVASLTNRLDVPELLLVGLGDAERYRGARLALGIARLGQWLRFTHAARVTIVDYNLLAQPVATLADLLSKRRFDIVGVSVNFGHWHMLDELATLVNEHQPAIVALGNILAAFSPAPAARLFDTTRHGATFVATSLGERPLERLCREFRDPSGWAGIDGLIRPGADDDTAPSVRPVAPPHLVYPDDALVTAIAERGGQISLETSFGCQYGACTFCPRDHRGDGWLRGHAETVVATLERMARCRAVVSFVDEEFFGSEGLIDPPPAELPAGVILATCRRLGIAYEVYTRLEQLFDRRKSLAWNLARARLLATEAAAMRRIFVGVESGSPTQLRRYGKGQTVQQTADALRVGSTLGIPMEFGFITFDPLISPAELAENVAFLARTDIICAPHPGGVEDRVERVRRYFAGDELTAAGMPLYRYVAYMATELEVLAHSRYADHLRRRRPDLLDGDYDPSFARHGVRYDDERIAEIANWCRVWTEAMFTPVYEARMTARTASADSSAVELVTRYRDATFTLLVQLTRALLPELDEQLAGVPMRHELLVDGPPHELLAGLAEATLPGRNPQFDLRLLGQRRNR